MTMVVIYSGQKAVSDTLTNSFMQENANQLRMQPIFAALKPRK